MKILFSVVFVYENGKVLLQAGYERVKRDFSV